MRRIDPTIGFQVFQPLFVEALRELLSLGLLYQAIRFAVCGFNRRHSSQQPDSFGPMPLLESLHRLAVEPLHLLLALRLGQHVQRALIARMAIHVAWVRITKLHEQFDGFGPASFAVACFSLNI